MLDFQGQVFFSFSVSYLSCKMCQNTNNMDREICPFYSCDGTSHKDTFFFSFTNVTIKIIKYFPF